MIINLTHKFDLIICLLIKWVWILKIKHLVNKILDLLQKAIVKYGHLFTKVEESMSLIKKMENKNNPNEIQIWKTIYEIKNTLDEIDNIYVDTTEKSVLHDSQNNLPRACNQNNQNDARSWSHAAWLGGHHMNDGKSYWKEREVQN